VYRISRQRSVVDQDIEQWRGKLRMGRIGAGAFFSLMKLPEFRSLLAYRIPSSKLTNWLMGGGSPALYIYTDNIGPGFFIQHGFASIIQARSIGRNFHVNQQVTIGYNGPDKIPVIGNNVSIRAGAIVLGAITVGDNAVIGAGAVVTKDVPANCVVAGVPAKVVREIQRE
jgi:serine O-acetyltransferase